MYKVFFNESFLIITDKAQQSDFGLHVFQLQSFNQIEKWLLEAEKSSIPHSLVCVTPAPDTIFLKLCNLLKIIEAAGGLVKNKKGRFLFIFRRGKWDLPKGKIDKGETTQQAAIREVMEETGLKNLYITSHIINTYHIYRLKGRLTLKKTYWYAMRDMGGGALVPQTSEDIEIAKWLTPKKINSIINIAYGSVNDVYFEAIAH